jgi:LmbE family N-acetylglucosaminyl deacetylase
MRKVVVISAHPDDETLGAGGTLLKHKKNGDQLFWIIVTKMDESQGFSSERIKSRQSEIKEVKGIFGFESVFELGHHTMTLQSQTMLTLIPQLGDIFHHIEPEIIYTLNRSDAHSDHRLISEAVMANIKAFRHPYIKRVLMYECISETEFSPQFPENVFIPQYFVDISDFFNEKLRIMKVFESELGEHPFPRSLKNIEALATFRGATAGCKYAEAFQVVKILE